MKEPNPDASSLSEGRVERAIEWLKEEVADLQEDGLPTLAQRSADALLLAEAGRAIFTSILRLRSSTDETGTR